MTRTIVAACALALSTGLAHGAGTAGRELKDPRRHAELVGLIRKGWNDLREGRYEPAAEAFERVLDEEPGSHAARVGFAAAEMRLGNIDSALTVVLDGLDDRPDSADLRELLGDLRNREERVDEAVAAWREAFRLAPTDRLREKIFKAERELHVGRDYDFTRTSLFNARFDGQVDEDLAERIIEFLEEQYWEISKALSHVPSSPITVILYPKRQFRDVTRTPDWVGGVYDGKIRVPMGGLARLTGAAKAVLVHELAHAFVHSTSRKRAPWWLDEGLAQWMSGRRVRGEQHEGLLAKTPAGRLPKGASDADVSFEYLSALSFVEHLESMRGMMGLAWLLEVLGEGEEIDAALERVYGIDHATLRSEWRESLREEE